MKSLVYAGPLIVLAFAAMLGGCSSATVNVAKYDPAVPSALVYSLPRSEYQVDITYAVHVRPKTKGPMEAALILAPDGVTLASRAVADENLTFAVALKDAKAVKTELSMELDDQGLLKVFNAKHEDMTGTIIENVIGGIASLAALAKSNADPEEWVDTGVSYKLQIVVPASRLIDFTRFGLDQASSESISDLVAHDSTARQQMAGILAAKDERLVKKYGQLAFTVVGANGEKYTPVGLKLTVNRVYAQNDLTAEDILATQTGKKREPDAKPTANNRLYYRGNVTGRLQLTANYSPLSSTGVAVLDAAPVLAATVESRPWTTRSLKLTMSEAHHGLAKFEYTNTSSAEAMSGSFNKAAASVATAVSAVRKNQEAAQEKAEKAGEAATTKVQTEQKEALTRERKLAGLAIKHASLTARLARAETAMNAASDDERETKETAYYDLRKELTELDLTIAALKNGVDLDGK